MARRNLFQPPPAPPVPAAEAGDRKAFPNTGAMSGVRSTLRDLSSNAIRELDPASILDGGPKDRLSITDEDVATLAESIRQHGQQVPIMVRPISDQPGKYRIVYGRRRLQALRLLGWPAKALVRSLNEEQAIIAQGQENSQRLDPSFIEKALFVAELTEAGHEPTIIMDALAVDKPMLSRMNKVARVIPAPVVARIGAAHGIGRRRWEELADQIRDHELDIQQLIEAHPTTLDAASSDERFGQLTQLIAKRLQEPQVKAVAAMAITTTDGQRLAEIRQTPRAVTVKLSQGDDAEFTDWMRSHAEAALIQIYESWKASKA